MFLRNIETHADETAMSLISTHDNGRYLRPTEGVSTGRHSGPSEQPVCGSTWSGEEAEFPSLGVSPPIEFWVSHMNECFIFCLFTEGEKTETERERKKIRIYFIVLKTGPS